MRARVLNKEMKYKLVVLHLDSVVHYKTVKRNNRNEREIERERER